MSIVQLAIVPNAIEAEMICALLRDCGIAASYRGTTRNIVWSGGTDKFSSQVVLVHEEDLAAAQEAIAPVE